MTDLGNEQNMDMVRNLMEQAQQVNLGGDAKHSVEIDYTTEMKKIHYTGTVVFKRPTMMDYLKIGGAKAELLRKAGVTDMEIIDTSIKALAHIMSTLKIVIVKAPEWLIDLGKLDEVDLLYYVYGKYEEWEYSFRKQDAEQSKTDSESTRPAKVVAGKKTVR
jgi:hypothetical protein